MLIQMTVHSKLRWEGRSGHEVKRAHNEIALLLAQQLDGTPPNLGSLRLEAPQLPQIPLQPCTHFTSATSNIKTAQ